MYTCMYVYIYLSSCLSIDLSMSMYIHTYKQIHKHMYTHKKSLMSISDATLECWRENNPLRWNWVITGGYHPLPRWRQVFLPPVVVSGPVLWTYDEGILRESWEARRMSWRPCPSWGLESWTPPTDLLHTRVYVMDSLQWGCMIRLYISIV